VGPRAGLDTEVRGKILFASSGDRTSIARSSNLSKNNNTITIKNTFINHFSVTSLFINLAVGQHISFFFYSLEEVLTLTR
jgi:hypothetical protein